MAVSKVEFGGRTLMDLTGDSVTEDALVQGYTAHDAAGNAVGGANPYEKAATDAEVLAQEQLLDEIVEELAKRCVVTEPILQARTVTPTEEVQVVTPDAGYDGLSSVTVEAAQGGEGTYGWKKCASRLPSGYTEVEYLQSSGTQYINTGFTPNQDTRVVMDCELLGFTEDWGAPFGARNSNANAFAFYYGKSNSAIYDQYASANNMPTGLTQTGRRIIDKNKNVTTIGDVYSKTFTYTAFTAACSLCLFTGNEPTFQQYHFYGKVYSCQVYDNGTLIRDFVPCTNASETAGLYDLVNDVFYANAGSGTFAVGPTASNPSAINVVGYVVSDDADAYPDGAFLDGYYYKKL